MSPGLTRVKETRAIQGHEPSSRNRHQREGELRRKPGAQGENYVIVQGGETLDRGVLGSPAIERDLGRGVGDYFRTLWFRVHAS